ncbi:MAG: F0F1 ATP synthase subunit A [Chloroflexi bacterium]|nr:F0F1 ATP synthase subunit A [Chloroflexota bacterium]
MRQVLIVVVAANVAALALAAAFGFLPPWPDIHPPHTIGTPLFKIAGDDISIANTHFTSWIVMATLIGLGWLATRRLEMRPRGIQNLVELVVQGLASFVVSVGGKQAVRFVPLFGTLFLFILLANYVELVPFVGQPLRIGGEEVEPLHGPTADYHTTVALALVSFIAYQFQGIRKLGPGYFSKFINFSGFKDGPLTGVIMLVLVGPIEIFSEVFRTLTLTLRLWGNIFGGAVSLAVMSALLVVPAFALPFIGLELLVGLVQALIFSLLVLVYIVLALESHEGHEEGHSPQEHGSGGDGSNSRSEKMEVAHA